MTRGAIPEASFEGALRELGVRDDTLTREERDRLDQEGFLMLHGVLSAKQVARMRSEMEEIFARERTGQPGAPGDCQQLQNKSDAFDICLTHPRLLAAVHHVLGGDFVSQGVHSRPNPPGKGHQAMHQDGLPVPAGHYRNCNSIWPLTDFTVENGATRVVPGSHLWNKAPADEVADLLQPHPLEVRLIAPAGSVVVFNGHLWHSAMRNDSQADRPNVTSFWARLGGSIAFDATPVAGVAERLGAAARRLLPA